MTRSEARMVAEELYKLMRKSIDMIQAKDEYLSKQDAAKLIGVSTSHFDHFGKNYPRAKVGKSYKYSKNGLLKSVNK